MTISIRGNRLSILTNDIDKQYQIENMNTQIDISPRKKQLKEEYERLQLEYAALVAERDELENSEGPRLTALYMEAVGQLQYEVLVLRYEIALLKQKRDLLQAYKNRGEKADLNYVDEQVEATAKTYNENIQREEEKIKQAKAYIEEQKEEEKKNQENEKRELRDLYRKLVHRLHPDLHLVLPAAGQRAKQRSRFSARPVVGHIRRNLHQVLQLHRGSEVDQYSHQHDDQRQHDPQPGSGHMHIVVQFLRGGDPAFLPLLYRLAHGSISF